MEKADFKLRSILLEIDDQLDDRERQQLCFLIGSEDVPRRFLDVIAKDGSVPMNNIWETLLDRRKITTNNVSYLIERLEKLQRSDLVDLLTTYCPLSFSLSATPSTDDK